jgi:hypothetical protein
MASSGPADTVHGMQIQRAVRSVQVMPSDHGTDTSTMHGRPTLIDRIRAAFGRRRDPRVLVLVNTTRGQKVVPMRARDLR